MLKIDVLQLHNCFCLKKSFSKICLLFVVEAPPEHCLPLRCDPHGAQADPRVRVSGPGSEEALGYVQRGFGCIFRA